MIVPPRFPRGALLLGAVYAALSLICARIPLLDYLGYEFSAVIAFSASVLGGLYSVGLIKNDLLVHGSSGGPSAAYGLRVYGRVVATHLTLLMIPLVVITANALIVKNCSLREGLVFYILLPFVSGVFSTSLAFFCAVHVRASRTLYSLVLICSIVYALALGYYTPAIYSYNFFYGYFPGFTYDEGLGISQTLVLFRILTLGVAALCVWMAWLTIQSTGIAASTSQKGKALLKSLFGPGSRYMSATAGVLLILSYLFRCELGFESTAGYIQDRLGRVYRAEHVVVYYAADSFPDDEIQRLGAEHEYQLQRIRAAFFLPPGGRLESYIYPSSAVKRRFIGAGETNIAKPWSGQVHITRQSLESSLGHEIVHAVAAPFGRPVIRASLSTGLVEGLAMAVDGRWGTRTLHTYAAALRKIGLAPDLATVLSPVGFTTQTSSVSYVLSGSFCRFLIDRYGMARMTRVYGSGSYRSVYGRSLRELINEWEAFLVRRPVTEADHDAVEATFRRPPMVRKVCMRVVGTWNAEAAERLAARDYNGAFSLFSRSYEESEGDESLRGYLLSALRLRRFRDIVSFYEAVVAGGPFPARYLVLSLTIGDAHWASGQMSRATELYSRAASADVSGWLTEASRIRLASLNDLGPASRLLHYFLSDVPDSTRLHLLDSCSQAVPGSWIPRYLKARVLLRMKRFEESYELARSFAIGDTDSYLEALRLRMVGHALFGQGRFQDAKAAFWTSLNFASTEMAPYEVDEWVERCEWMSHH